MTVLTVLGIPVTEEQVERWLGYYCPGPQPFRTADLSHDETRNVSATDDVEITDEFARHLLHVRRRGVGLAVRGLVRRPQAASQDAPGG